ncbi:MAG: VOC family protein, partial [Nitrospiraceae bacterium]
KFYGGILGMTVAGSSLNVGSEQEYLDSLPGARARVTGLKPPVGTPGVEFLEYELPAAGRPMPADARPTDLLHWQVTLVVNDVEEAAALLRATNYTLVSSGVATLPDGKLGFQKGLLVRDPDGHVMQLVK